MAGAAPIRVLITRAEPGATRSCAALDARGLEAMNAATATLKAHEITLDLKGVSLIAVTSPFGATCLAGATPERRLPVIAVGDVTASANVDAGDNSRATEAQPADGAGGGDDGGGGNGGGGLEPDADDADRRFDRDRDRDRDRGDRGGRPDWGQKGGKGNHKGWRNTDS